MKLKLEISKAVIQEGNKYLLLKRASNAKHYPGRWDFPGGKLNKGEDPAIAVVRETKEETALDIEPESKVGETIYEDTEHFLHFHYFAPTSVSGEIGLSDAHSEYKWVDLEEISKLKGHSSVTEYFDKIL